MLSPLIAWAFGMIAERLLIQRLYDNPNYG